VHDLELRGGQLESEGDLIRGDQVGHAPQR
jgi:hypothetical protein